jgi:hypothetical protein
MEGVATTTVALTTTLREGAAVRLVLIIEQVDDDMPTVKVELIKNGSGVIASANASAFDDPVFQLQEATRAIRESCRSG